MRLRWTALAVALVVIIGLTCWADSPRRERPVDSWVLGYYVGYLKDEYPLEAVRWDSMTHVVVGAALPRPDGTIDTSFFQDPAAGPRWARSVVAQAHAHDRRALLMLGGADSRDAFSAAASDARREKLVDSIVGIVDSYGFDGVDVDWEPMDAADGPGVIGLAHDLRQRRPDLVLTAPVGPVNINRPDETVHPFVAEMATAYDRLNIMSYGMNGGWRSWSSWHGSALAGDSGTTPMSVDSSFRAYTSAGIPGAKLGIGIGFFGSCMRGVTGPRQASPGMKILGGDNTVSYTNIVTRYLTPERRRWDESAAVPYLTSTTPFGPLGCTYLSYEDERSIAAKAAYAKRNGIGGAIVWNINQGYLPAAPAGQRDPLMDAVRRGFLDDSGS